MREERLAEHGKLYAALLNTRGQLVTYVNRSFTDPQRFYRRRSDIVRNEKSKDGWRKPSAYSVLAVEKDYGLINCEFALVRNPKVRYYHNGAAHPNGPAPVYEVSQLELERLLPPTSVEDEAITKALNQLADRKGNILESAAELRSSVAGLARNATTVSNFLSAAVRKDWTRAAQALGLSPRSRKARRARDRTVAAGGGVGSAWLNYWFGLMPILDDMVFAMIILGQDREIRLKGAGTAGYLQQGGSERIGGSLGFSGIPYQGSATVKSERGARCVLWYSMRTAQLARFNELGAYDVPATIWASQPYSWLVDFVIPVSQVMRAWTADVGLTFRGGSFTRYSRIKKSEMSMSLKSNQTYTMVSGGEVDFTDISGFMLERSVYSSAPKPTSLWIKDPLDAWKAATALALLATKAKTIFNKRQ